VRDRVELRSISLSFHVLVELWLLYFVFDLIVLS